MTHRRRLKASRNIDFVANCVRPCVEGRRNLLSALAFNEREIAKLVAV
jgi:hypothetical protein